MFGKKFYNPGTVTNIDRRHVFLEQGSYGKTVFLCCSLSFIYELMQPLTFIWLFLYFTD